MPATPSTCCSRPQAAPPIGCRAAAQRTPQAMTAPTTPFTTAGRTSGRRAERFSQLLSTAWKDPGGTLFGAAASRSTACRCLSHGLKDHWVFRLKPTVLTDHVERILAWENQNVGQVVRCGHRRADPLDHAALRIDADARRDLQKQPG